MALTLPKIGILSIGDMGMGIAKLLVSKGFSVATNGQGRRHATTVQRHNQWLACLRREKIAN